METGGCPTRRSASRSGMPSSAKNRRAERGLTASDLPRSSGLGCLFFPYDSYFVGLVVGIGPDFSPVGAAPGIEAYDVAGLILWIAGGSILFAWPASLLAAPHRKHLGA